MDLENTALGPNTLKFQRACSLDQDGIQTNFRKYINLCRDQVSPFHFAELHAMTTNELKAMQCKVVCVDVILEARRLATGEARRSQNGFKPLTRRSGEV